MPHYPNLQGWLEMADPAELDPEADGPPTDRMPHLAALNQLA